jgi:small multidrug resistance pump
MQWLFLFAAIIFEICGTSLMKISYGFTKLWPSIGTIVCYIITFTALANALKKIPVSVAYAIWCAAGIVILSVIGILFFKESINFLKVLSTVFIVLGVIGLYISDMI